MINQTISTRTFVVDSYIHAFIALVMMSAIFMFSAIKRYRKDIIIMLSEAIDEINLSNYVSKTDKVNDDARLDNLENIYKNDSYFSKEIESNINISLYTQLGILAITVIIVCYIANKDLSFWKKFFHEKIVFFIILICLEYIFYEVITNEYKDILKEDVYNILKNNIDELS